MEEQSIHGNIGDINSAEAGKIIIPRKKRVCLVGASCNDPALNAAAQQFKVAVLKSETGLEHLEDTSYNTYFVLKQFEGPEYEVLCKSAHRVLGPTALLQLAERKESLPSIKRPMYTQAMVGTVVVFSGFRAREDELRKLASMILSMGGSIRKEMGIKVTHLIANHCSGEKYRYADTFGLPIMSVEWVTALWNAKDDTASYASNGQLVASYKLKPFYGARVCFSGFPEEEKRHMCEVLEQQGGEPTEIDDPNCTHVVIDVADPSYETSNSGKSLRHLENPPPADPFSPSMYLKPVRPSSLRDPSYPNVTTETAVDHRNVDDVIRIDITGSISSALRTCEERNNAWNDFLTSHDSAVNVNDSNSCPREDSIVKSGSVFHRAACFAERSDSGIDVNGSSNLSAAFPVLDKCPVSSTLLRDSSSSSSRGNTARPGIPGSPLFSGERPPCENSRSNYSSSATKSSDNTCRYMRDAPCERNNAHAKCTSSLSSLSSAATATAASNSTLSLKYRRNIRYIQNNTSPNKTSSKRYVKWSKSSSCTSVHKMATVEKYKFLKTRSFPSIPKHCGERYSDTFLQNALGERGKRLSKSHTSVFTRLSSHFSLCPSSPASLSSSSSSCSSSSENEHDNLVGPRCYLPPEKTLFKKRYTSLSCKSLPIPSNGKTCNLRSAAATHVARIGSTDPKEAAQKEHRTRAVVDESNVNVLPNLVSVSAYIVKTGWFWTSVQNEAAADEKEYLFEHYLERVLSPTASGRRDSQQIVAQNVALPKHHPHWLGGPLSSLLQNGADSPASVSGSFLDCTASPDKQLLDDVPEVEAANTEIIRENLSQRHQVFLELVETEANYVGILSTIMTLFKLPLENLIGKSGKELLNSTEVKIIFGNFPPIYDVHKQLLEALRCSAAHWTEDVSIGKIFLKFEPDLVKAYPPYVNFFENTKQMLEECDQSKPRFHAFLKNCQTIPECGRQSLKELLIKPVQRLPSISLLLNDILKRTGKNNPDYSALEASISCIKKVMTYINEDKRKTERQLAMFDIFNEIDNCPPHLVSSHRSFLSKCDVVEITEGLSGRGDHLVLFLFTDTLEICKKRSKAFNSLKSPNTINGLQSNKLGQGKPYKHVKLLPLSAIRKVVDIRETDECHKVFALVVRSAQELKEKLYSFVITDEEVNKTNYLQTLCRQMALVIRVADADTLLIRYDSHQLEVGTSDVASGTLKKTIKSLFHNFYLEYMDPYVFLLNSMCETTLHVPLPFASRTRARVGRAFSFNKTPSKLNRAMSTIMSPFGAAHSLAPANSQQIAQMRLGSCNNISELDNGGSSSPNRDDVLVAPMSDQPTRKALSMASLRRL